MIFGCPCFPANVPSVAASVLSLAIIVTALRLGYWGWLACEVCNEFAFLLHHHGSLQARDSDPKHRNTEIAVLSPLRLVRLAANDDQCGWPAEGIVCSYIGLHRIY
jgi:hypothetical protein